MTDDAGLLLFAGCTRSGLTYIDSLESAGFRITTADDPTEIGPLVSDQRFELVILDQTVLGDACFDILQTIRQTRSVVELAVLVLTDEAEPNKHLQFLNAGCSDVVSLPMDPALFVARVSHQCHCVKSAAVVRESEARYALACSGSNDGLWDWNLLTDTVYYSPRWCAMLGIPEADVGDSPQDWLERVHPEDLPYVQDALSRHLSGQCPRFESEHRVMHSDQSYRWMLARGVAVRNDAGVAIRMAGSQTDITRGKAADPLTGLPNRILFTDRLKATLKAAQEQNTKQFAVLFLDMDRFKFVNDSLGHHAGDELLVAVAERLETALKDLSTSTDTNARFNSMLARFGGDEFVILLNDVSDPQLPRRIADQVLQILSEPVTLQKHEVEVSASIGVALGNGKTKCLESLLRDADTAMYHAKTLGKGRSCVFSPCMRTNALERFALEVDLKKVVERGEYKLQYQPIIEMVSGQIVGFEALARWAHPVHGVISPSDFIPVAEETGAIVKLGLWTLGEACRQLAEWRREFPELSDLFIAVNVSSRQFADPSLVRLVLDSLESNGLACHDLKIEITESTIMLNPEIATQTLTILHSAGVGVCIDDFGTGHSSLSYLQRFPINTVKIDRSFISRMTQSKQAIEIVKSIIDLSHNLDMDVTAEGVEYLEQHEILRELDCELGQGFLYSRPRPVDSMAELLQKKSLVDEQSQIPFQLPGSEVLELKRLSRKTGETLYEFN